MALATGAAAIRSSTICAQFRARDRHRDHPAFISGEKASGRLRRLGPTPRARHRASASSPGDYLDITQASAAPPFDWQNASEAFEAPADDERSGGDRHDYRVKRNTPPISGGGRLEARHLSRSPTPSAELSPSTRSRGLRGSRSGDGLRRQQQRLSDRARRRHRVGTCASTANATRPPTHRWWRPSSAGGRPRRPLTADWIDAYAGSGSVARSAQSRQARSSPSRYPRGREPHELQQAALDALAATRTGAVSAASPSWRQASARPCSRRSTSMRCASRSAACRACSSPRTARSCRAGGRGLSPRLPGRALRLVRGRSRGHRRRRDVRVGRKAPQPARPDAFLK